jgi:Holliday junction resolvase-like predicted endonuclease
MNEICYIDIEMTNIFTSRLISAIKNSGYKASWGGVNGELDIIIYSNNNKILSTVQIRPRSFKTVIYIQIKTRSKKFKNLLTDILNKLLSD